MKRSAYWANGKYNPKRRRRTSYAGGQYGLVNRYAGGYGGGSTKTGRNYYRRARQANWRWGGFLGLEKKYFDASINATAFTTNTNWTGAELDPAANALNTMAQGNSAITRIGNRYNITGIQIAGAVVLPSQTNQTTADAASTAFWALVWDKQTNAAQLNSEDVYTNPSTAIAVGSSDPFRNMQFAKRFKVMKTWTCVLKPPVLSWDGTNMEQGGDMFTFSYYHEFKKPIRVECVANGATVADIMNHSFHVIGQSNDATVTIAYNCRIRFTDP